MKCTQLNIWIHIANDINGVKLRANINLAANISVNIDRHRHLYDNNIKIRNTINYIYNKIYDEISNINYPVT